jgi:hypothetical protein
MFITRAPTERAIQTHSVYMCEIALDDTNYANICSVFIKEKDILIYLTDCSKQELHDDSSISCKI